MLKCLTVNLILHCMKKTRGLVKLRDAKFILSFESDDTSETCRVTIIVSDHNRRIQRLKIEDHKGVIVER
jgi:hypothetical protein